MKTILIFVLLNTTFSFAEEPIIYELLLNNVEMIFLSTNPKISGIGVEITFAEDFRQKILNNTKNKVNQFVSIRKKGKIIAEIGIEGFKNTKKVFVRKFKTLEKADAFVDLILSEDGRGSLVK